MDKAILLTVAVIAIGLFGYFAVSSGRSFQKNSNETRKNENAVEMNFRFNRETSFLESNDPAISVLVVGSFRDSTDADFVLHLNNKKIGFSVISPNRVTDNGVTVWEVNKIGNEISRFDPKIGAAAVLTDTNFFDTEDEQALALGVIEEALLAYGAAYAPDDASKAKQRVIYSTDLKKKISDKHFIRDSYRDTTPK